MLYIFCGNDTAKSSDKARKLIDSLRSKRPDASFVSITEDNWSSTILDEHICGQGLFSNKYIVFLDRVTANQEAKDKIIDIIVPIKNSDNIFIVLEGKVGVELSKIFNTHAEKVVVTNLPEVKLAYGVSGRGSGDFNIFALADAIGVRDRMKAWTIYRQAIDSGLEAENIIGTIFWQLKSMAVAINAKSAAESGLSPFVYSKSKRFASNYSTNELDDLIRRILVIYHDGHRGLVDMELALERMFVGVGFAK